MLTDPPVKFTRPKGMLSLPTPARAATSANCYAPSSTSETTTTTAGV